MIKPGDKFYKIEKEGIKEYTVTKVGRKYFYIDGWQHTNKPFNLETLKYNDVQYMQYDIQLYKSAEEIMNNLQYRELFMDIASYFRSYPGFNAQNNDPFYSRLTLDNLKQIHAILYPKPEMKVT